VHDAHARAEARRAEYEIHSSTRTLLVKSLEALSAAQDDEVKAAASAVEELREKMGLEWDELIIKAVPVARAA
jgi:hypothetical protein